LRLVGTVGNRQGGVHGDKDVAPGVGAGDRHDLADGDPGDVRPRLNPGQDRLCALGVAYKIEDELLRLASVATFGCNIGNAGATSRGRPAILAAAAITRGGV
jgi:hypothetical protein